MGYFQEAEKLFQIGKAADAMDLYGNAVLQEQGEVDLEPLSRWFQNQELIQQAGEEAVCLLLARLMGRIDRQEEPLRDQLRTLSLEALRSFSSCAPRQDTTDRYVVECILYRHMGKPEEGLKAALLGIKEHGTASCATFAGLCCMDLDDVEKAEGYIRQGLGSDPGNGSGCNDLGDYFFKHLRYDKAMEYYQLAMEAGDSYDCEWAEPSWLFCRYRISGKPFDLERLTSYAAAHLENDRAYQMCDYARREQYIPYVDYLPGSTEASINFLREMRRRNQSITGARMALSCQEAASSILAIRLALSDYGKTENSFTILVNHIPDPPLDTCLIPEGAALWKYDSGMDAAPLFPYPSEKSQKLVKKLAESPFSLKAWYEQAGELAEQITAEDYEDLFACMTFPPRPEIDADPEDWLMLVQYAAVCILARLGDKYLQAESEQMRRWAGQLPSPELARICMGQLDWPVIPALTLLAWQSKEGIAEADPVLEVLSLLMDRIPKEDYCFFEHALISAFSWLPGLDGDFHQKMRTRRRKLEEY